MTLVKAVLKVDDPKGINSQYEEVEFQYNPTKYSVNKSLEWTAKEQKGKDSSPLEFKQGKGRAVSMELLLDDFEDPPQFGKVADRIKALDKLTLVNQSTGGGQDKPRPPIVMFIWGNEHAQFRAVINSLNVNYTLFHSDGSPARATVSLQLKEWIDRPQGQNPTSMGSEGMRAHRVIAGETLDLIAYRELGSATHWPYIAELNNLDDPLSIEPGQYLVVAPLR